MSALSRSVVVWSFAALVIAAVPASAQNLEIHEINVGWGMSIFVKGPNGTTVLLESGGNGEGAGRVLPYLASVGFPVPGGSPRSGFDYVIVGHQHEDHMGAIDEVIGGTAALYDVRIRNYYNGDDTYVTADATNWKNASIATTAGVHQRMAVGTVIDLGGGATLTCVGTWNPTTGLYDVIGGGTVSGVTNQNDRSVAILIECGGFDYLWASDLGGGAPDACTSRSTTQMDLETPLINGILAQGLISAGGLDVLHVNHHGSESSTNVALMNSGAPELALVGTGNGQSVGWNLPRADVVDSVLLAGGACITVPAVTKVLQTEEGNGVSGVPGASNMSLSGFAVGNIKTTVDCTTSTYTSIADGAVTYGPNELASAGLPLVLPFDEGGCTRPTVSPTASAPTSGCTTVSTTLHANAAGGSGNFTAWAWSPATGLSCTGCSDPTATVSATTTWTVTVTDSLGCTSSPGQVTLTVSNLAATPSATPATICTGGSSQLSAAVTGGIGTKTYSWRALPSGSPFSTVENPVVSPVATTTYEVTVTDSLLCSDVDTTTVTVSPGVPPSPPASVTAAGGASSNTVSWSAVPGAASYLVYRSIGDCTSPMLAATVAAPTTSWIDSAVIAGWGYCYSVAVDNGTCRGSAGRCGADSCAMPGPAPEVSGGGATVRLRISKSGATGAAFSFEDKGTGYFYDLYNAPGETEIDTGNYSAKWCDLAAPTSGGSFVSASGTNTWSVTDLSTIPSGNFLVVGVQDTTEGSYGFKSSGAPRNPDDDGGTPADTGCGLRIPKVVISQIYGGGGNSGATYRNDFIELHNVGNVAQNVTGWSVQYASAAGSSWAATALTGSIPAGGFYLVQQGAGAGGSQDLPTPDATGSTAMSATAAKVALVASTTALSGTCPTVGTVRDMVGYGGTASCFEGAGPTPAPSNTNSVTRKSNACQDTDVNSADFAASTAYVAGNPRNSGSPLVPCP